MFADLAFFGTLLTVDAAHPTVEALTVTDGRIVAVGSRADVEALIGPDTEASNSAMAASCQASSRRTAIR